MAEPLPSEAQQPVYLVKRNEIFTDLLYEMGTALGYDVDKTEISRQGYSTVFHEKVEADANFIREKLVEVLGGKAAFPIAVVQFPHDPELEASHSESMRIMAAHLREGKPFPIAIVDANTTGPKAFATRPQDRRSA